MTTQQITISIPSEIPLPQFSLFQQVRRKLKHPRCECGKVGIIVGMDYTSFRAALKDDLEMGWEYTVDWLYGSSEAVALEQGVARESYSEDSLEAVEEG